MGMFDYVELTTRIKCPNCHENVITYGFRGPSDSGNNNLWQTKDGPRLLDVITEDQLHEKGIDHFYAQCENCKTWIDAVRRIERHPGLTDFDFRME